MMVVLFHLNAGTHLHALTRNGWAAVDFFFVLSGFVLMSASERRLSDAPWLRRFSVRRLARLYPLHLFALAVLAALVGIDALRTDKPLFADAHGLAALLQSLALIQGFTVNQLSWNFPSWSISIELWASLVFGVTLFAARERSWIVLGLYALVLAAVALILREPDGPATNERGVLLKDAHYLAAFFAGALLFKAYQWASRRGHRPPAWTEVAAALLVAVIFVTADEIPPLAIIVLFAVVISIFAFDRGPISRTLQSPAFQALGLWSYSIYLIHPFWTIATLRALQTLGPRLGQAATGPGERLVLGGPFAMDLAAVVCLALVVATASLTYRFIERPGQRLGASPRPS